MRAALSYESLLSMCRSHAQDGVDSSMVVVAAARSSGIIHLWCACTGRLLQSLPGHTAGTTQVGWSPCGSLLVSASLDATARVWRWQPHAGPAGKQHNQSSQPAENYMHCYAVLAGHRDRVTAAVFLPDSRSIATASRDATIRVWRVSDSACLHTLSGHAGLVTSIAISPCGTLLASASGAAATLD
jgi:WD40 repeat protein